MSNCGNDSHKINKNMQMFSSVTSLFSKELVIKDFKTHFSIYSRITHQSVIYTLLFDLNGKLNNMTQTLMQRAFAAHHFANIEVLQEIIRKDL